MRRSRHSSGARRSAPAPPLPDGSRPGRASHPPAPPSRRQHVTGQGGESVLGTDAGRVDGAHAARHEAQPPPPARIGCCRGTTIAAAPLAEVAHARPKGPDVPDRIQVEDGHNVYLVGHAVGVQIYSCTSSAGGTRWTFVGPRADVFGENGQLVMTHFGGPTWQGRDGSTVVGSRVDGVTVDPTAIPWLLLSAASTAPGPRGGERLAATTFIQRINTTGGLEPPARTAPQRRQARRRKSPTPPTTTSGGRAGAEDQGASACSTMPRMFLPSSRSR